MTVPLKATAFSASDQSRRQSRTELFMYLALVATMLVTVQLMQRFSLWFGVAFVALVLTCFLSVVRPDVSLPLIIGLAVVGDDAAMPWWPVSKNLSARESILYVSDAVTIKPIEIVLLLSFTSWFVNWRLGKSKKKVDFGLFGVPMLMFVASVIFGLGWGLMRGGDLRVAIFEVSPLLYIPLVYLLAVNVFISIEHYYRLLVLIAVAISVEVVHGLAQLSETRERIPEGSSTLIHTAALHMNLLFLFLVASVWFGSKRPGLRPALLIASVPTMFLFIDSQRRAGVIGLILGGMILASMLFVRNRPVFYRVIPIVLVISVAYLGAFWNSSSSAGFPAQAVKTVVQPDSSSSKDSSSDLYRDIETFDLEATIRSSPVLGIGFGMPFLRPIPLPSISAFGFANYIPHNTVLWMWTKLGVVGFLSFVYMIGAGTAVGVRAAVRMRDSDHASTIAVLAAYLPMLLVVAYVEISGDAATMTLFAVALAAVSSAHRWTMSDTESPRTAGLRELGTRNAGV